MTEKQLLANKANAQLAGVKTKEGKAKVRHNSFKHGLTSTVLISGLQSYQEALDDLEDIYIGLHDSLQPQSALERDLVVTMAKCQFKMRRYEKLETCLFEDNTWKASRLEISDSSSFELILKYKQSIEATYYRAFGSLMKLREAVQLPLFPAQENNL